MAPASVPIPVFIFPLFCLETCMSESYCNEPCMIRKGTAPHGGVPQNCEGLRLKIYLMSMVVIPPS